MLPLKSGVNIINSISSVIQISFLAQGQEYKSQIKPYHIIINERHQRKLKSNAKKSNHMKSIRKINSQKSRYLL